MDSAFQQKLSTRRRHVGRLGIADLVRVTTGGLNPARPCRAKRRNARGPDRVGISYFLDPVVWLCYEESEPGLEMAPAMAGILGKRPPAMAAVEISLHLVHGVLPDGNQAAGR